MWRYRNGWFRDADFERRTGAIAAVSARERGDMDRVGALERNLRSLGLAANSWAGGVQVHGTRVRRVAKPTAPKRLPATDGFATNAPGVTLWIRVADCAPVFISDPRTGAGALVHAGWRGARKNILSAAVRRMGKWYGSRPAELRITIGPHIQSCCYAVGPDVAKHFQKARGAVVAGQLDLTRALRTEARRAGVPPNHVTAAPQCTACGRRLFSFRRHRTEKRLAAVMAIVDRKDA